MAFARGSLALQGSGAFAKHWTYESADAASVILAADYFLSAYRDLKPGDIIFVRAGVGGTREYYIAAIDLSSSASVTTVCSLPLVAFSALGTDLEPIINPP